MIDPRLVLILTALSGGYDVGDTLVDGIKKVDRAAVHGAKGAGKAAGHGAKVVGEHIVGGLRKVAGR